MMRVRSDRRLWRLWLSGLVIGMMLLPGTALAGDDKAIDTATATATDGEEKPTFPEPTPVSEVTNVLRVLGADLTVQVVLDETGHVSEVNLDPAAQAEEGKHGVSFVLADGETEVRVSAHRGAVQTKVKTNDLANVVGPGVWSADLFGNGVVEIGYTVTVATDGTPSITIDSVSAPGGVESERLDPKTWSSEDGSKAFAGAGVLFTFEGERKKVSFRVTSFEKDGVTRVTLSASLSGGRGFRGWHGWFGCRDAEWKDHFGREFDPAEWAARRQQTDDGATGELKDAGWFGGRDGDRATRDRDGRSRDRDGFGGHSRSGRGDGR